MTLKYFYSSIQVSKWTNIIFIIIAFIFLLHPSQSADKQQNNNYDRIDNHASKTSKSIEKSVTKLVQYLIKPCANQQEKARAIYYWITHNIDYNVNAFLKKEFVDTSPEAVLKNKKSVCDGYAGLFQQLATEAGLEAVKISGYAKAYNYELGSIFNGPANHAWNAVKIDGSWYLLDATWGSGYMNENNKYIKYFDEYYFLTPPAEFIYNHYPDKKEWQLLENPISKQEYEKLVCLKPAFFYYDLKIVSHKEWIIETDDKLVIELAAAENISLIARLLLDENELAESYTFTQRSKNQIMIHVLFPEKGRYILRIFARHKKDTGKFQWALDYQIETSVGTKGKIGFPEKYSKFEEVDAFLFNPLNRYLKSGEEILFSIQVPRAEEVVVIAEKKFIPLTKNNNQFSVKIKIKKGEIVLAAKFPGKNQYNGLLKYSGF